MDAMIYRLKVKKPWRDEAFWLALLATIALTAPELADGRMPSAEHLAPMLAYLVHNGWLRGRAITATGEAMAAENLSGEALPLIEIEDAEDEGSVRAQLTGSAAPLSQAQPSIELWSMRVKPRLWTPYRRTWAWDAAANAWRRVWVTNWRTIYVKPIGSGYAYSLTPAPGYKKYLTHAERERAIEWAHGRRWQIKLYRKVTVLRYPWLDGDTDAGEEILERLNRVGAAARQKLWIASGFRTREEQQYLYDLYLAGKGAPAAKPGTSRHERYGAADVHVNGQNIGNVPGMRTLLAKHGLKLPYSFEPWHVELA